MSKGTARLAMRPLALPRKRLASNSSNETCVVVVQLGDPADLHLGRLGGRTWWQSSAGNARCTSIADTELGCTIDFTRGGRSGSSASTLAGSV